MLLPLLQNLRMLGSWVQWDTHDGGKSNKREVFKPKLSSVRKDIQDAYKAIFKTKELPEKSFMRYISNKVRNTELDDPTELISFIRKQIKLEKIKRDDEEFLLLMI